MTETTPDAGRLVAEALAKSGLLWVTSAAGSAPCWHVAVNGVAYVVSGPGEQFSPEHEGRVEVVARSKETRARLVSFAASAQQVTPADDDWESATFGLKAGRLNAPAEDVVARWAREGRVTRLTPDLSTVVLRGRALPAPADGGDSATEIGAIENGAAMTSPGSGADVRGDVRAATQADAQADLGTRAPGSDRPAAAAAAREHRAAVRADADATASDDASADATASDTTRVGP